MCGIFGSVGLSKDALGYDARPVLRHRGPDASGSWHDPSVILQHTRLSIIDLNERSNQPFSTHPDYVLIYNGEIYNFRSLKRELQPRYRFSTDSDTEVLYALLILEGIEALNRLNGMFAFAFYDRRRRRIFISRDRYGVKPVYYYHRGAQFIFASEQKAIFPLIDPVLNPEQLAEYLGFNYVVAGETLVRHVRELEPGHYLRYDLSAKSLRCRRWYDFPEEQNLETPELDPTIKRILNDAVMLRTISDVPIGMQLSGGVDSAIVTRIVCQHSRKQVRSYSIGFPGSKFDESKAALQMASRLHTKHTSIDYTITDFLSDWPAAVYQHDEPITHPHALPIMKLTRIASKDVKVLLSGEGADEVFYGYEQYRNRWNQDHFPNEKEFLRACLFNSEAVLKKMLGGSSRKLTHLFTSRQKLLRTRKQCGYHETFFQFTTHLLSLLNRIDKMSMTNAVEIRTPYLDYRLVELGLSQRKDLLIDPKARKKPLMRIYRELFGKDVSAEKKVGFRVPYDQWHSQARMRNAICERLSLLRQDPFFAKGYVAHCIRKFHRNKINGELIKAGWVLSNYAQWKNEFKIQN